MKKNYFGDHTIRISAKQLQMPPYEAEDFLIKYFYGFSFDYSRQKNYWLIKIKREDFTYCGDAYLGAVTLGINQSDFNNFRLVTAKNCLCLSESWIPYAWSVYLSEVGVPKKLTIIHIDDHSDLMSPYISQNGTEYYDMLTDSLFIPNSPLYVQGAIESGAIPIGAMLTPIVMSVPGTRVLHLKQGVTTTVKSIKISTKNDSFLKKNTRRICAEFGDSISDCSDGIYLRTSDLSILNDYVLPDSCVLLHIDMDFFNNRYNGSTSWETDGVSFDPSFEEQAQVISSICSCIGRINQINPINCTYIGLSPSFYPTEFWKLGLQYLLNNVHTNLVYVDFLMHQCNLLFQER